MRTWISLIYWFSAATIIALVLLSVGYNFAAALFMGALFIPTAFAAKVLSTKIRFAEGMKVWLPSVIYLTVALLATQYLLIFMANYYLLQVEEYAENITAIPQLMLNPIFLLMIMALFVVPEHYVSALFRRRDRYVDFVSDRRRVKVEIDKIAYLESNDTEVCLYMTDGGRYRTRAKISTWERLLDDRFLRVHRSFIVNRSHITSFDRQSLTVADRTIEFSRKYREIVRRALASENRTDA